jgi:hypothetical protein
MTNTPAGFRRALFALVMSVAGVVSVGAQDAPAPIGKDPLRATALGLLIPGAGQFYAARGTKGTLLLVGTAATAGMALQLATATQVCPAFECPAPSVGPIAFFGTAAAAFWIYGAATAADDARAFNRRALQVAIVPRVAGRRFELQLRGLLRW